ncbi:MAG: hypothetical protein AAFR61_04270 [Bacteroidota bacterium]
MPLLAAADNLPSGAATVFFSDAEPLPADAIRCYRYHQNLMVDTVAAACSCGKSLSGRCNTSSAKLSPSQRMQSAATDAIAVR